MLLFSSCSFHSSLSLYLSWSSLPIPLAGGAQSWASFLRFFLVFLYVQLGALCVCTRAVWLFSLFSCAVALVLITLLKNQLKKYRSVVCLCMYAFDWHTKIETTGTGEGETEQQNKIMAKDENKHWILLSMILYCKAVTVSAAHTYKKRR